MRRLELGPLSVASLHRLIADRTGTSFPRPTFVRIAQVSGGNPLYALEIARLLAKDGELAYSGALPVPTDLQELVGRRLAALEAGTRAALVRVAAVKVTDAGDPVAGAKVAAKGQNAKTNAKGVAQLTLGASTRGKVTVTVTHATYRKLTKKVAV